MEINFDSRGNLKPYEKIEVSSESFRKHFVDDFTDDNQRRVEIFDNYLNFLQEFKQEVTEDFIHRSPGDGLMEVLSPRRLLPEILTL